MKITSCSESWLGMFGEQKENTGEDVEANGKGRVA